MDLTQFDDELRELLRQHNENPGEIDLIFQVCYGLNIRSYHNLCIDFARRGLTKDPFNADLYYELIIASSLDTAHILAEIISELDALLDTRPYDQGTRRNLALVHYFLENDEDAETILEEILADTSSDQIDLKTFEVLAQLEYTRQNLEDCIQYCDTAIDKPGPSARMVRLKGLCYREMGDLARAAKCFLYALKLEPNFVWACHSMAVLSVEREDFVQAFRYFGKASYINPKDPGNLFLLSEAFIDLGAYDLAAAELNKLLLFKPEKRIEAEVHNALGYLSMKAGDLDDARAHLSQAIELEPELAVAYYNMGQVAQQQGATQLAEYHFKHALNLDEFLVEAWVELGFFHFQQENFEESKVCFNKALDLDPDDAQALLGLSKHAHHERDAESQLQFAQDAYELDPDHSEICNNLGIAYECNGSLDEAEKSYKLALEANTNNSAAANNLGYLYEKKMTLFPEKETAFKRKAVEAWKTRLRICLETRRSTEGAITHLLKLGLTQSELDVLTQAPPMM